MSTLATTPPGYADQHGDVQRRLLLVVAVAIIGGTLLWVLLGPKAEPALCVARSCDCERIGPPPVRQPVAAWSALAIVAVGVGAMATATTLGPATIGLSVVTTGAAAFAAHALATTGARHIDGLAVVVLVATVLAAETARQLPAFVLLAVTTTIAAFAVRDLVEPVTAILGLLLTIVLWRNRYGRDTRWAVAAAVPFGIGAAVWWAAGGPWCAPGGVFQWHGVWHLSAAVGLAAGLRYLRSGT
jgi:hypothetical protein